MTINNDIGFIILKLTNHPIYDTLLENISTFVKNMPYDQVVIFNSFSDKINTSSIPILHISHAKFFNGTIIVFDLASIILTKNFTNIRKKILYTRDMPWVDSRNTPYGEWVNMYNDASLDIVANSHQLSDVYQICWKKPIGVAEDINYEQFKNFI